MNETKVSHRNRETRPTLLARRQNFVWRHVMKFNNAWKYVRDVIKDVSFTGQNVERLQSLKNFALFLNSNNSLYLYFYFLNWFVPLGDNKASNNKFLQPSVSPIWTYLTTGHDGLVSGLSHFLGNDSALAHIKSDSKKSTCCFYQDLVCITYTLLWSISPTFYEQLLHQYPCAKKNTNLSRKYRKAAKKTFVRKSCQ